MMNKEPRYISTDVECLFCNQKLSQDTEAIAELEGPDDTEEVSQWITLVCFVCGTKVIVNQEMAKEEGIPYKLK